MEKRRPQLNINELLQLRWFLGGGLALISVWTVFYLEINTWLLAALATVAIGMALVWPSLPARIPALAHKLAFPVIVIFFAWDLFSTGEVLPAIIRLDLLLLGYRGTSYRKKRDDLQIVVLGLILVTVAGVLTLSLVFAIQILLFTACTLAFLLVITLTEATQAEQQGGAGRTAAGAPAETANSTGRGETRAPNLPGIPPSWAGGDWRRLAQRLRAVADWRLLALGGVLFIGVVAVSALLFMVIPRFQLENSFFLDRWITKKSRTGFSDSIRFGDVIDIQQDNSVALRVDVTDPSRLPATPYWRMVVLDEYRAGVLRTSPQLQNKMELSSRMTSWVNGQLRPMRGPPVYWTFYFEAGISRHLPVAGVFYLMRFREPQWVQQQPSLRMTALRNEPVSMIAYRVEGMLTDGFLPDRAFRVMLDGARRIPAAEHHQSRLPYPLTTVQLPERTDDQQSLARMADSITGGARVSPQEFAARASRWLRDHHAYSLRVNLPGGERDPVVMWTESDLPGHCELFAAAFTLLARAAGYPTRVITGFKGGDWNGYENYFMVRNAHAHAWCEMYDGGTGWLRIDPTDGAASVTTGEDGRPAAITVARRLDRSWQARLDAVRILWYRRIVNFDQRTQLALVQSFKETTGTVGAALGEVLNDGLAAVRRWWRRPWDRLRVIVWLAVALGAAGSARLWWHYGRSWWWRAATARRPGRADPIRREAGRWLRKLVMAGPQSMTTSGEVMAALQRLRYGPRESWPDPRRVFHRARQAIRGRPSRTPRATRAGRS